MKLIELMMRLLTHLNIGAIIALAAWFVFSTTYATRNDASISNMDVPSSGAVNTGASYFTASVHTHNRDCRKAAQTGELA